MIAIVLILLVIVLFCIISKDSNLAGFTDFNDFIPKPKPEPILGGNIYWSTKDHRWRTCPVGYTPSYLDTRMCTKQDRYTADFKTSGIITPPGYANAKGYNPMQWDFIRNHWYGCPEGTFKYPYSAGSGITCIEDIMSPSLIQGKMYTPNIDDVTVPEGYGKPFVYNNHVYACPSDMERTSVYHPMQGGCSGSNAIMLA